MLDETYAELRARMVGMLNQYGTFWEVTDPHLSPWPEDPDGGDLRLAMCLRSVIAHPRTPPAVLEMIADRLAVDSRPPLKEESIPGEF